MITQLSFQNSLTFVDFLPDNTFMQTFITTYQSFSKPWTVFEKLKQRYAVPDTIDKKKANAIQLRVIIALKYWVETQLNDFDEDLIAKLFNFIDNVLRNSASGPAESLRKVLEKEVERREEKTRMLFTVPQTVEVLSLPFKWEVQILLTFFDQKSWIFLFIVLTTLVLFVVASDFKDGDTVKTRFQFGLTFVDHIAVHDPRNRSVFIRSIYRLRSLTHCSGIYNSTICKLTTCKQQLTLVDFEIFSSIQVIFNWIFVELVGCNHFPMTGDRIIESIVE